jgi:ferredoxin-NADP reductase
LLGAQNERDHYVIGVALERESRGGSRHLFEKVRVGDELMISQPRNLFALDETAPFSVLIGGGIGITPLISMSKRLTALRRPWQLHFCSRSRALAPFLGELAHFGSRVSLRFDDQEREFLDISAAIGNAPDGTHFYCCGPKPMMKAFRDAVDTTGLPAERAHVEYFSPQEETGQDNEVIVELKLTGRTVAVPPGSTILDALRAAGVSAQSSCESGICGECQVTVLEGIPDHKDAVLTDSERASNRTMMICCSGSKSERLVLDL